jgi:hypothetical protein
MTSPASSTLSSPAELAALIIVNGAIPSVIAPQEISGQIPVEPRTLAAHERESLGLNEPGVTLAYRLSGGEVFLDLGGAQATVWFNGPACAEAIAALEAGMQKRFPQAQLLTDEANSGDAAMRVRHYRVNSSDGALVADLRATYPAPSVSFARRDLFLVRVFAQRRGGLQ